MKKQLLILLLAPLSVFAQAPGGISTNLALWNKANTGVTVSGTTVTGWTDQKATNTFTVAGTPQLSSNAVNYNPSIVQTGSSRFVGNTSITFTHALIVGRLLNGSGITGSGALLGISGNGGKYFFHTEGFPRNFTCSDGPNTTNLSGLGSNSIGFQILSEDMGRTPASSDVIRTNGLDRTNSGGDPASFTGTPVIGARNTEELLNGSELVETIVYSSSLSAANLQKVESYLGVKYGFTLNNSLGGINGDYVSSGGTTIWDASNGSAYHNNVIGIGRDDGSALLQKQSHQGDDATRIYVSTLAADNITNAGSFSSDGQFVMIGDNTAAIATNISNTEYPTGLGILNRIDREWKVTNTAFTGTFSMDITPSSTFNPSCVRVLIDDDGDFSSGATMYSLPVTNAGGVITVSGITTQMISTNTTKYVTLVIVPLPGGVGAQTLWLKADAGITQSAGAVSQWDDVSGDTINLVQATATQQPTLNTDTLNYYPVPAFDAVDDNLTDATVAFNALLNVTTGTNTNTTGSMFLIGKVKTFATDHIMMSQWNTASAGNFYSGCLVSNTSGNMGIGGRTFGNAAGLIPLPNLNPFMASSMETPGTNNTGHYLNGGKERISTIASVGVGGANPGQYLKVGAAINGYVAEAITYRTKLTDLQRRQVESYLALKYAITLDTTTNGNGSTVYGDYIASDATTTWDASLGSYLYHNNVIGIGRDDSTALNQKQSHQLDDSVRLYVSTLSTTNVGNSGTFSSDKQFVIMGADKGITQLGARNAEVPAGQGIYSRIDRQWKITNTNFTGTFSLDITLHTPQIVTAADLRILIDDDGNFTNATMFNPTISYAGGVVTITGISNAMIPANSTKFLTIASISSSSTLPVKITSFTATAVNNKQVQLNWQTASESNSAYFKIERSADGQQWEAIGSVKAAGNSSLLLSYAYTDNNPLAGVSYYRLKQVDADNNFAISPTRVVRINAAQKDGITVYPNPVKDIVTIEGSNELLNSVVIYDAMGREVKPKNKIIGNTQASFDLSNLPIGLYFARAGSFSVKLFKQ